MSELIFIFFVLTHLLSINCLEEKNLKDLWIEIDGFVLDYIGKKGTISIYGTISHQMNIIDISRNTLFKAKISDDINLYEVDCGIWIYKKYQSFVNIFCNVDEKIPKGNYSVIFDTSKSLIFHEYNITTMQPIDEFKSKKFEKLDKDLVDIYYSGDLTLNVEEETEIYDLKFKIVSYNNEKIVINDTIILDCDIKYADLTCHLYKKDLDRISINDNFNLDVGVINYLFKQFRFPFLPDINVKYKNLEKKDIYVNITKLIQNNVNFDTYAVYETNVTDIIDIFNIKKIEPESNFKLDFINENNEQVEAECLLRKYNTTPLLILCTFEKKGNYKLKEITSEINLENINAKYNFKIQPVKNEEIIFDEAQLDTSIYWVYPEELDFTKNDILTLEYYPRFSDRIKGIALNEEADYLNCEIILESYIKCTLDKHHFNGKKSGYYFTKHSNPMNAKSINYEVPPIKVIVDENSTRNITYLGYLYYLVLLIFIIQ